MTHHRSRRSAITITALACTGLTLAGCSRSSAPGTDLVRMTASPMAGTTIIIKDFAFQPTSLNASPGAKITVTNQDATPHTVTASGAKAFDTGSIQGGQTTTFTAPTAPGSYPYICSIHPNMHATLIVK